MIQKIISEWDRHIVTIECKDEEISGDIERLAAQIKSALLGLGYSEKLINEYICEP